MRKAGDKRQTLLVEVFADGIKLRLGVRTLYSSPNFRKGIDYGRSNVQYCPCLPHQLHLINRTMLATPLLFELLMGSGGVIFALVTTSSFGPF